MLLWTPLTPPEIAKAMHPYIFGRSARPHLRWRPHLSGRLGSQGMIIQRIPLFEPDYPRLRVDYQRVSRGTALFGLVQPTGLDRMQTAGVLFMILIIPAAFADSSVMYLSLPVAIAVAYCVYLLRALVRQNVYRRAARWYFKGLVGILSAEVLEAPG